MGLVVQKLMIDFLKSNSTLLIIYTILNLILYPINSIFVPKLYSELIGRISNLDKDTGKTNHSIPFPHISNFRNYSRLPIPKFIFFIISISIFVSLIFRVKYYMYSIIYPRYKMWLREILFSKMLEKRNTDFEEQKVGKEIMRMEDIIWTIREIFNFLLVDCSELLIISFLIVGYLFTLDSTIACYSLLQIIIIGILIWVAQRKIKETTLRKTQSYYEIADNIDNTFNNLSNVLINNQTKKEVTKNKSHSNIYKNDSKKSNNVLNNLSIVIRILTLIFFALILLKAYRLTIQKKITPVNFTTIVILLLHFQGYLYGQAWNISNNIDRTWQIKYNDDYFEYLLSPEETGKNLTDVIHQGKIEFKNINFKYKKADTPVLRNLNLTIEAQEKVGILGKSGSGKSTLVKLLIKLYTHQHKKNTNTNQNNNSQINQILIDGIPNTDINTQYLRHKVNYINQNTLLFDEDIYYNIKYGNKRDVKYNFIAPSISSNRTNNIENINNHNQVDEQKEDKKIEEILLKYDLLSIYDNLENGLRSKAGPKGTNLSLGMQKITILMRGLMRDSQILIFDEPLAGLDQKTRQKVIQMIVEETKNKTVLVITHDPEILPYLDRSVNLADLQDPKP